MIYLNNGATSYPKPQKVIDAVKNCISEPVVHAARTGFERENDDHVYLCRKSLARLLNIPDPLQIVFTSGSTEALNLAIKGTGLDGHHVVTTSIEHNSVLRPLKTMELNKQIELTIVPCDSSTYVDPDDIKKAMRPSTKAVVVNHCSNVTGSILDIKAIAAIAHAQDALIIVDASQSAGAVPIDFDGWDIDFMAVTGHKSLYGIQGSGALLVKKGLALEPLKIGGTGILSELLTQPEGFPIHYEAGTPNTPGIIALGAGVDWVLETGIENIHARKKRIFERIFESLCSLDGLTCYNTAAHHAYSNYCFNIKGMIPEEAGYMLDSSFDIMVRTGLHCAPLVLGPMGVEPWGTIRASHSYFTTDVEVDLFIDAVNQINSFIISKKRK